MIVGGGDGRASSRRARPPRLDSLLTLRVRKERVLGGFRTPLVFGGGVLPMFFWFVGGVGGGGCLLPFGGLFGCFRLEEFATFVMEWV